MLSGVLNALPGGDVVYIVVHVETHLKEFPSLRWTRIDWFGDNPLWWKWEGNIYCPDVAEAEAMGWGQMA